MRTPVRLLALLAAVLTLALPTAVARAHDGPHPSDPVAQGRMHGAAFGYHSDAVAAVPDEKVVAAVARRAWAAVPDAPVGTADSQLPETWCGDAPPALAAGTGTADDVANQVFGSGAAQFKVIYAYANDQTSRFAQLADRLQANVLLLSRFMAAESGGTKTIRFDMGTSCGDGYVDIQVVRLPRNLAAYAGPDFDLLATDIRAIVEGSQPGPRDWIVYADRTRMNGVAGTGEFYYGAAAESPAATSHDSGRLVSVVWGPAALPASPYADPTTMLHEMGHNLGAVQGNAPNSTGNENGIASGHCTDEWDVMCYADGGPDNAMTYPCAMLSGAVTETFDCGGDDYFAPSPGAGSWLASHWNVYASAMLGSCAGTLAVACGVDAAPAPLPVNTTPAAPQGWVPPPYWVALSGTDATRLQWRVDGGPVHGTPNALVLDPGVHTLETRAGTEDDIWSEWRPETVRIDGAKPVVALSCVRLTHAEHACSASADDAESGVAALTIAGRAVASGETVTFTAPAALTATATDRAGNSATAQRVITLEPAPPADEPATTKAPIKVGARGGKVKGAAELTISATGGRRSATLALGRLRAPAGSWKLKACLRQAGRPARCRTRTVRLPRAGRLPAFTVSAELAAGPVQATVDVARKRGRRFGKAARIARASAG